MKGTTHLAAGVTAALLLSGQGVVPAAAIIAGSVLPDIDSPKSLVGRHWPIIPRLLPHRTVTHSFLCYAVSYLISPYLALGVLIHIFLDMLNPKGVKFFWPCRASIRVPIISKHLPQDGVFDNCLGGVLYFYNVYLLICLILQKPAVNMLLVAKDHIAASIGL